MYCHKMTLRHLLAAFSLLLHLGELINGSPLVSKTSMLHPRRPRRQSPAVPKNKKCLNNVIIGNMGLGSALQIALHSAPHSTAPHSCHSRQSKE